MASKSCAEPACPYVDLLTRELDAIHTAVDRVDSTVTQMSIDITLLKYKSGMFGAAAGLIPGLITAAALYFNQAPK